MKTLKHMAAERLKWAELELRKSQAGMRVRERGARERYVRARASLEAAEGLVEGLLRAEAAGGNAARSERWEPSP